MSDSSSIVEIETLIQRIRQFARDRDWEQFHSPKNLAMGVSVEAAELVEIFQWLTEEESKNLDSTQQGRVEEELADVAVYLLKIADCLNIDLLDAIDRKLTKNEIKYPADLVRGSAKKYSDYH